MMILVDLAKCHVMSNYFSIYSGLNFYMIKQLRWDCHYFHHNCIINTSQSQCVFRHSLFLWKGLDLMKFCKWLTLSQGTKW